MRVIEIRIQQGESTHDKTNAPTALSSFGFRHSDLPQALGVAARLSLK
jgi:hypothetical protein